MRRDAFVFLVLIALSLLFFLLKDGSSAEEYRPTSVNELSGEVILQNKLSSSAKDYTVPRKQVILEIGTATW